MKTMMRILPGLLLLALPAVAADDRETLTALLDDFLARAGERAAHERFWADELVYTSSNGTRFGKAEIMQGFDAAEDETSGEEAEESVVNYSGDNVDVRVYGATAIVAFRLVGTPADGSEPKYYYNTGTFLKRDGVWKVIAWQATIIPPEE